MDAYQSTVDDRLSFPSFSPLNAEPLPYPQRLAYTVGTVGSGVRIPIWRALAIAAARVCTSSLK